MKLPYEPGQIVLTRNAGCIYVQNTVHCLALGLYRGQRLRPGMEHINGIRVKQLPLLCQGYLPSCPVHKGCPHLILQVIDMGADRGLGQKGGVRCL